MRHKLAQGPTICAFNLSPCFVLVSKAVQSYGKGHLQQTHVILKVLINTRKCRYTQSARNIYNKKVSCKVGSNHP